MQVVGGNSEKVLVEYDQIRAPSSLDATQRRPPARHAVGFLEVRPQRLGQPDPLLGVERLGVGFLPPPAQERRLEREEGAGAVVGGIRSEEELRAGALERPVGVGASGARAPLAPSDGAIRDLMDGLNRSENAKCFEPGKIVFPCELNVLDPGWERKAAPALNRSLDCVERVPHGSVADRVDRDGQAGLLGTRASILELGPGQNLGPRARIVLILLLEESGSRSER